MIRLKLRCRQFVELVNAAAKAIRALSSSATLIASLSPSNASSTSASTAASLSAAESCRRALSTSLAASSSPGSRARGSQSAQAQVPLACPEKLASNVRHGSKYKPRCVPVNRLRSLRALSNEGRTSHTTLPCKLSAEGVVRMSLPSVLRLQRRMTEWIHLWIPLPHPTTRAPRRLRLTYQVLTPPPLRPTPHRQHLAATQTPRPTPRGIRRLQGRTLLQAPLKSQGAVEAAPSPLPPLAMDVDDDAPTQAALKSALEYGCGMRTEYRADAAERPEVQACLERTWSAIAWPFSPRWV
ncbi:hypothetical protein EDB85DRAFT_431479 [Lactarius pseudohatsudake]|nr:hypothetical protein EDB85DRAFT_431479 [Lactarius pseudohatsudake]